MWINRKRLMVGDKFILSSEKTLDEQNVYTVRDRVQVLNIHTLLSQRDDIHGGSRAYPREMEEWIQYDGAEEHTAFRVDTGAAYLRIGGDKATTGDQPFFAFPPKVFLVSEL
jgi:hypothetical protein